MSKDLQQSWEQRSWQYALDSYERQKRILELAEKVGSELLIERAKRYLQELETKYPQLLKSF